MAGIILKTNLEKNKIDVLFQFLESWNIDVTRGEPLFLNEVKFFSI